MSSSKDELPSRAALRRARRVCVKAGTSVVANPNGSPSLTRVGALVEQVSDLVHQGVQVILVSSGAVGMGKRLLRQQQKLQMSFRDIDGDTTTDTTHRSRSFVSLLQLAERPHTLAQKKKFYDSACAAAGQFEMMHLYSSLFSQCNITASQILVTQTDFTDQHRLDNIKYAIERLLSLGIVPILNENDAVSANEGYTAADVFSDNDSLAALCARSFDAQVLLLLTDVAGVYDRPPSDAEAVLLPFYQPDKQTVTIGDKSAQGRGGMASKLEAAIAAVQPGTQCNACVIAAGHNLQAISGILGNNSQSLLGTLFCTPGSDLEVQAIKDMELLQGDSDATTKNNNNTVDTTNSDEASKMALAARTEARKLQNMPFSVRQAILTAMSIALLNNKDELLQANQKDLDAAKADNISSVLQKRLQLSEQKLQTLAAGLEQVANSPNPLGKIKSKREISNDLILQQISVPIGVLLIIFESRPDSMPQIASLAVASGNGLLLKGGKEAVHSNAALHKLLGDAIESASNNKISRDLIGLITSRSQVTDLLKLDHVIDLVIPRGSNALVSYIQQNTRIPVLGHADGVCHVYIDKSADSKTAARIVVDAKTSYPSACNAMETLLLHQDTLKSNVASDILRALRAAGVKCLGGPNAIKAGLCDHAATELKCEYGDLTCMVEVVADIDAAIDHIHKYGSGHTEAIVSSDETTCRQFLQQVDAACVFSNASTRFADGFRFGLGAEVGIATGRIHARGPVGVEGLLTTKWQLTSKIGHTVADLEGPQATAKYTHKEIE